MRSAERETHNQRKPTGATVASEPMILIEGGMSNGYDSRQICQTLLSLPDNRKDGRREIQGRQLRRNALHGPPLRPTRREAEGEENRRAVESPRARKPRLSR